ncbi:NAD(P)-binding protein [Thozetella sp. PMI_491]|nr:NAD(P)-binding protein [Thozetella sp. PMI_491]
MSTPIVAIAGFTGNLARLITASLLESHPEIKIHGITRSPAKVDAAIRSSPNLTVFEASASNAEALGQALKGASVAICCYLGSNEFMVEGQKTLIDACVTEGVPRYIASDWSLNFRALEFGDHPMKDPMKHIQAYLEEKEKEGKITAVHVLNGGFTNILLGPYSGYFRPKEQLYQYWGTGDEAMDLTTYQHAAAFTAEVAADPSAVGFLNVLGDRKTVKQVAETYESVYGEKLTLECLGSLDDLKEKMTTSFRESPQNERKWMGDFYLYHMLNGKTSLEPLHTTRYINVKPQSVEEYFASRPKETLSSYRLF